MRSKRVEFTPPEAFALPEGVAPDEDFDMVATFRVKQGGTVCLVAIGDVKMPGYDDSDKGGQPMYEDEANEMMGYGQ